MVIVVIAIITILAGILLPALNKARGTAHSVSCLNKLKQHGVYWTNYADSYKAYLLPSWNIRGDQKLLAQETLLVATEAGFPGATGSLSGDAKTNRTRYSGAMLCPAAENTPSMQEKDWILYRNIPLPASYSYNAYMGLQENIGSYLLSSRSIMKMSDLDKGTPSEIPVFGEQWKAAEFLTGANIHDNYMLHSMTENMWNQRPFGIFRCHSGGSNFVWGDLHASAFKDQGKYVTDPWNK